MLWMISAFANSIAAAAGVPQQGQQSPAQAQPLQSAPPGAKPPSRLSNTYGPFPTIKWTRVADNKTISVYAGLPTIFRSGDMVTMWYMVDYKNAPTHEGSPYLSKQGRNEYDCKEKQERELAYTLYSGKAARGDVVYLSYAIDKPWEPVKQRGIDETLLQTACEYR
jgi:hypothetical protein